MQVKKPDVSAFIVMSKLEELSWILWDGSYDFLGGEPGRTFGSLTTDPK